MRKILFITWTRADYYKLLPLIRVVDFSEDFESHVFVTGMHTSVDYWYTAHEVQIINHNNLHLNINHNLSDLTEKICAQTIINISQYCEQYKPSLIVVHGDRPEAIAGAIVWGYKNILVCHIEWWENSWSIDESVRFAITKLSQIHFVSNNNAKLALIAQWENQNHVFDIWSPEFDLIYSEREISLKDVKRKYAIDFDEYWIFIFHGVATEFGDMDNFADEVISWLINSGKRFIIIYPNNDLWSLLVKSRLDTIDKKYSDDKFIFFSSIPFLDFSILLSWSRCIVWNSSTGVRQAPWMWVYSINIGTRQNNRSHAPTIFNVWYEQKEITALINGVWKLSKPERVHEFWEWNAWTLFKKIIYNEDFWKIPLQKSYQ